MSEVAKSNESEKSKISTAATFPHLGVIVQLGGQAKEEQLTP